MRALSLIAALCLCTTTAHSQSDSSDLIQNYQKEIEANPRGSMPHYRLAELFFEIRNYQSASNEFREALNGDLQPKWVEVWSHLNLARIFDLTGQHDRAVNEYRQAVHTGDNTRGAQVEASAYLKEETGLATARARLPASGPEPTHRTEPEYSEEARAAGLEGTVFVDVAIGEDGAPLDAQATLALGLGLESKAIEAVKQWRFAPATYGGQPAPAFARVAVDFLLPSKLSRWHLVGASFEPPEGASRPVFLMEPYPLGAGISNKAIDEGWVLAAIRRSATVKLAFDVNEGGIPEKFQVLSASDPPFGNEAIAVVQQWRFTPGAKDGEPISVPCTLDLVWGQKTWTPEILAKLRVPGEPPAPSPPVPTLAVIAPPQLVIVPPNLDTKPEVVSAWLNGDGTLDAGGVILLVVIGEDGIPIDARMLQGLGTDLDATAMAAVRQWRFQPTLLNGKPVSSTATIELDFRVK